MDHSVFLGENGRIIASYPSKFMRLLVLKFRVSSSSVARRGCTCSALPALPMALRTRFFPSLFSGICDVRPRTESFCPSRQPIQNSNGRLLFPLFLRDLGRRHPKPRTALLENMPLISSVPEIYAAEIHAHWAGALLIAGLPVVPGLAMLARGIKKPVRDNIAVAL